MCVSLETTTTGSDRVIFNHPFTRSSGDDVTAVDHQNLAGHAAPSDVSISAGPTISSGDATPAEAR